MSWTHQPVMLREVVEWLRPRPGAVYFDGTVGGGGHSAALLEAGACVVAVDRDPAAVAEAGRRLGRFAERFRVRQGLFTELEREPAGAWDGVLLDLGVSSHQLDTPGRGFSFRFDAELDMRMDPGAGRPAWELLAETEEAEMARWFREYGEEPRARALAREIARGRARRPLRTTGDLVGVAERVCGAGRARGHHPATRVFQAVRIAVNGELELLARGLEAAPRALKAGGRLAVITFHSLEDRIVKRFIAEKSREWEETPAWPNSVPNPGRVLERLTRKAVAPSEAEVAANPRARSAKLRVAARLPDAAAAGGAA